MEPPGRLAGRPTRRQPALGRPADRGYGLTDLGSAPVPPAGPDDRVRAGPRSTSLIVYADYECPFCAVLDARLAGLELGHVFRHFPVRSKHPRAWAAACAAEAAGLQDAFWPMHDALFADQGRLEDPHLWDRARDLSLDLGRFDADRRSEEVRGRVERDFRGGLRAGVMTTPTVAIGTTLVRGVPDSAELRRLAERGH